MVDAERERETETRDIDTRLMMGGEMTDSIDGHRETGETETRDIDTRHEGWGDDR